MNSKEIRKNNNIIGRFMSIRNIDDDFLIEDPINKTEIKISVDELQYHLSYDWIYTVFNKIRLLLEKQHDGDIEMDDNHIRIHWDGRHHYDHTVNGNPFDIEVAYEAVILFIKWFDRQKGYS